MTRRACRLQCGNPHRPPRNPGINNARPPHHGKLPRNRPQHRARFRKSHSRRPHGSCLWLSRGTGARRHRLRLSVRSGRRSLRPRLARARRYACALPAAGLRGRGSCRDAVRHGRRRQPDRRNLVRHWRDLLAPERATGSGALSGATLAGRAPPRHRPNRSLLAGFSARFTPACRSPAQRRCSRSPTTC
jgi:hypothetical protein